MSLIEELASLNCQKQAADELRSAIAGFLELDQKADQSPQRVTLRVGLTAIELTESSLRIEVGGEEISFPEMLKAIDMWRRLSNGARVEEILRVLPPAIETFTTSTLPLAGDYDRNVQIFVRNGRKTGETAGNGTGVWCSPVGNSWCPINTSAAVLA